MKINEILTIDLTEDIKNVIDLEDISEQEIQSEIEGYRNDLISATTKEEKSDLRVLITERGKTLNTLLTQPQQQQQQQGGKFYIHIVHCVFIGVWCG